MFDRALKLLLLISPILYISGINIDKVDLLSFPIYSIILFTASLFSKPKRYRDFRMIGWLLALCGVNYYLGGFNPIVLSGYINLFLGCLLVLLITIYTDDYKGCFKFMMYAGLINLVIWTAQRFGYNFIIDNPEGEPGGIFGNAPRMCMYLALILPYVMNLNIWIFFLLGAIGFICGEYILSFFSLLFLMMYVYDKEVNKLDSLIIFLILFVIGGFCVKGHILKSLAIRWMVWEPTIQAIIQEKVRGYGLGIFSHVSDQFYDMPIQIETAMSSILQFTFGVGILGLLWLGFNVNKYFRGFKFRSEYLAILGLFILSIFEYPFEVPKLWLTICAILGFYLIKRGEYAVN